MDLSRIYMIAPEQSYASGFQVEENGRTACGLSIQYYFGHPSGYFFTRLGWRRVSGWVAVNIRGVTIQLKHGYL